MFVRTLILKCLSLMTLVMVSITLFSCQKQESIENPYFTDTSDSTPQEFLDLFTIYRSKITDYYYANYSVINRIKYYQQPSLPEYQNLDRKPEYSREETEKFDAFLDQKFISYESKIAKLDETSNWSNVNMYIDECKENSLCIPDSRDNFSIHFSLDDTKLYLDYIIDFPSKRSEYTFYMELDELEKLHVIAEFETIISSGVSEYIYLEYIEDEKEMYIVYDQYGASYYYFDLITQERIKWSDSYDDQYHINYYNPVNDLEFSGMYHSDGMMSYILFLYENGHRKLSYSSDDRYGIGLNHVTGWDSIKRTIDEEDSDSYFHLYQDGEMIDEKLVTYLSEQTGDVIFHINTSLFEEVSLEDLISLSHFGLNSGFTLDDIETLREDTLNQVNSARDFYGLSLTKEEMLTWFTEKTGKTVFTD